MRTMLLCALAAFATGTQAAEGPARSVDATIAELAQGGLIILMRHANAPQGQHASVGLTQGCDFADGRGLDAKGFFQARFIGEYLKSEGIGIGMAYTSDSCRAYDTARLVAAGAPVAAEPALKTTSRAEIDAFKMVISTALRNGAPTNVLLVSHSNIVPLYVDWGSAEEIPSGVVLIVDPKTWTVKERLNFGVDMAVEGAP
jgi:phosphohistidine phosphatase SixA